MVLPYKKWTEEEVEGRNASDAGDYPFKIVGAIQKSTKGGVDRNGQQKQIHQMLEIDLEFHDINGVVKKQKDWIVFVENMDWKLRHLANACGLLDVYEDDRLEDAHLRGKTGVLTLGIKEVERDGQKNKMNFVKDYVKKSASSSTPPVTDGFYNDDVTL
jgi:hypothetical protein